ncbi:hypothetical protein GJ496_002562 [Pomphorhynchus laevis]|nr:hypothetical protein GJ496_002562 [Pomphorhynchus laevis]
MIEINHVKRRMETEVRMSYSEFSYQIMQSYDWIHLFKKFNCKFQMTSLTTTLLESRNIGTRNYLFVFAISKFYSRIMYKIK